MENYTLITGASSGVGRETAVSLSQTRALILSGRNKDRLRETKELCAQAQDVVIWPYDLSDIDNLEAAFSEWLKVFKLPIESFVHCAGALHMVPLKIMSLDILRDTYAVNVFAPCILLKLLASKRKNGGNLKSVVFISSNISNRGASTFSAYGSSKSALDGLMRNLSVELAPAVRVNSILPGGMKTRMTEEMFNNGDGDAVKNYPLGIGCPKDIAPVVEFLLSERAGWVTGQQLTVDGGRTTDITERTSQ